MWTGHLAAQHDTFSRNTRIQLGQLFEALRELTVPPVPPKRPIGFVTPEDKNKPRDTGKTATSKGKAVRAR